MRKRVAWIEGPCHLGFVRFLFIGCGDDRVEVGDEVVLLGRQGEEEITADEWAERTETISWEIVTRMGERLPRRYSR